MVNRKVIKFFKNLCFLSICLSIGFFLASILTNNRTRLKATLPERYGSIDEEILQSDLVHGPGVKQAGQLGTAGINVISDQQHQKSDIQDYSVNYNVHVFYYAWYGAPAEDGLWYHWNHKYIESWDKTDKKEYPTGVHVPPDDIGANYYPILGPYSSRNVTVVEQHFAWLQKSNIGVVAVSWYPPGLADENGPQSDKMIPLLLNTALKYKLKICLHVEPYTNRTASTMREHLRYVHETYGSHPAYYTIRRGARKLPLFYIYDSYQVATQEWTRLLSRQGDLTIRDTELDGIFIALLVEMKHRYDIKRAKFDGFYTYFAANGFTYGSSWKNWKSLADYAFKNSLTFIPSVGPGYIDTRVRPWNSKNTRDRRNGVYYETAWRTALATSAKIISITSFNEWHEGTQIEPAGPHSCPSFSYQSYFPQDPDLYLRITKDYTIYPSIN